MTQDFTILYDGQCPFCSRYVALMRLRKSVGKVVLVDARSDAPQVGAAIAQGLDLDEGMAVIWGERTFYGADAVHLLATLSGSGGVLNRVQRVLFSSPRRAAWMYPVLAQGRRLFLRMLGRRTIAQDRKDSLNREF